MNPDMIGIEEADKALQAMMAADEAAAHAGKPEGGGDGTQADDDTQGTNADVEKNDGAQTPEAKASDGKAADGTATSPAGEVNGKPEAGKPAEGKGAESGSRFAQSRQRLEGGWKELNTGKAQLQAEQETWRKQQAAEKLALEQERADFEAERSRAEGQYGPEEYDKAAARFEREGKLDLADLARQKADALRKNPPAKPSDRLEAHRKEWALKAGQEFPELVKANSPLQLRVAQLLKSEPDLEKHPKGIYLAARLATLEGKATEATGLQTKLTETNTALETAKKRIKELEELVTPGTGENNNRLPAGKRFEDLSDSEQFAELERQAQEVGVLTR